jgi:hypothetical protein
MDRLDTEIVEKLREVASLRKQLEALELEVKVLKRAAQLRPSGGASDGFIVNGLDGENRRPADVKTDVRKFGRQPGAISMPWRGVLKDIYDSGNHGVNLAGLVLLANRRGIELLERSAKETTKRYVENGFLDETRSGEFVVTEAAISRFDLSSTNTETASAT